MHKSWLWTNRVGKIYDQKYEICVKFKRIDSKRKQETNRNGIRDVCSIYQVMKSMATLLQTDV